MSGANVDAEELIDSLALDVSELQHERIGQMPLFPTLGIFVALDRFGADEIRQRLGVTERLLAGGLPDALLFAGPRRGRRFDGRHWRHGPVGRGVAHLL